MMNKRQNDPAVGCPLERRVMPLLLHGDCLELMAFMPDGSVDAIICDLPYGTTACKWDAVIPFEPLWAHYKRVIKPNGAIVLFSGQPFTSTLICSNLAMFKYAWVWDKNYGANFLAAKKMPLLVSEDVCVFSYGGANNGSKNPMQYYPQMIEKEKPRKVVHNKFAAKAKNPKYHHLIGREETVAELTHTYPKNMIRISNSDHSNRVHPTQKPVALLEYLIRTYTNEGETVMDNCMGSGTTGIACLNTGRNFTGIEKDAGYFEIARNRIMGHNVQIEGQAASGLSRSNAGSGTDNGE